MPSRREWVSLACICLVIFAAVVGMVMLFDIAGKASTFVVIVAILAIATLMVAAHPHVRIFGV